MFKKLSAYIELTKPRILTLVLVTALLGFYLGGEGIVSLVLMSWMLFGVACVCAGSSALNQYLERDADQKMHRTRNRPIPSGTIVAHNALGFGAFLVLFGVLILYWKVNLLTAFLSLLTAFLYVLVYTPMKKVSWLNTSLGSIPGALPPMGGWAAATGELSPGAWALFLILFVWQHPHFYAIAWICKDDYKRAGFKMLPVVEPDGKRMFDHVVFFSWILLPISLLPTYFGLTGKIYFLGAWFLGAMFLLATKNFTLSQSTADARKLLRASVIYLPLLLMMILIDFQI